MRVGFFIFDLCCWGDGEDDFHGSICIFDEVHAAEWA
jgi:hypothetical protein